MKSPQQRLDDILRKLRQRNLRVTPQRIAILKAFLDSNGHPSVDQVYGEVREHFPTTSLATVYKTVHLLKELDEILEIDFADGRKRYDGNKPYPHPHLICTGCHRISDPQVELLGQVRDQVARTTGYRITSYQVEFFGLCPACRTK